MQLPLALLAEPQPFDPGRYMALVGALIVALLAVGLGFRRLVGAALKQRAEKRSLRVVDVLPLGGKRQLAVVKVYDRTFALGLGDKEVTCLAELDPVEAEPESEQAQDPEGYAALIGRAQARLTGKPSPSRVEELVG